MEKQIIQLEQSKDFLTAVIASRKEKITADELGKAVEMMMARKKEAKNG